MTETAGRVAGALVLLVALWICVYWWTPGRTKVAFAQADDTMRGVMPKEPALKMTPEPEAPARVDPVPVEPVQPKPQQVTPEPKVTPKPDPTPERPVVVVPPQFTQHTVQKGETFDSIARKYFGPKAKGSIIANANPMVDPKRLMPGRVLQVPKDPNNIQGVPVKPKTDPATPPVTPVAPVAMEEYVVQEGDTLSSIAQEVYGESRLWEVIYQANRDQLPRENALKIGQKLKVPAKPAR